MVRSNGFGGGGGEVEEERERVQGKEEEKDLGQAQVHFDHGVLFSLLSPLSLCVKVPLLASLELGRRCIVFYV